MTIRERLIDELNKLDDQCLSVAYMYATNYCKYGIDITQQMTAVQNNAMVHRVFCAAFDEGYNKGREDAKEVHNENRY